MQLSARPFRPGNPQDIPFRVIPFNVIPLKGSAFTVLPTTCVGAFSGSLRRASRPECPLKKARGHRHTQMSGRNVTNANVQLKERIQFRFKRPPCSGHPSESDDFGRFSKSTFGTIPLGVHGVQGVGCRVRGVGCRMWGVGCRV